VVNVAILLTVAALLTVALHPEVCMPRPRPTHPCDVGAEARRCT
jgi:hypothetical protein